MLNKEYKSSLIISGVLHILVVILLMGGSWFSDKEKKPQHKMVEAVVIDPRAIEKQAQSIRDQRDAAKRAEQERAKKLREETQKKAAEQKRKADALRRQQEQKVLAEKKAREAEKQRKIAEQQKREEAEKQRIAKEQAAKAEAARKAKEAEIAKAQAEQKLAQQQAETQRQQEAERQAKAKAEAERKAQAEAAAKAKADAAERARKEQEKQAQEQALNDIFSGLEAENVQISSARQRYIATELERYGAIYKQMIQDKLLTEDSFRGKSCKINIRLVQTGKDAIVSQVKSINGDTSVCAAAKRAVAQVSSFPMPTEQDVADKLKNIDLIVAPE